MLALSTQAKKNWLLSVGLRELLNGGYLWMYDGVRPSSPDQDVSGNLIAVVTKDGLYPNRHSNELLRNGVYFDFDAPNGILYGTTMDLLGEKVWKVHVVKNGSPIWFRFTYWNDLPNGASMIKNRMDGTIGSDLILINPNLYAGSADTIDEFRIYL